MYITFYSQYTVELLHIAGSSNLTIILGIQWMECKDARCQVWKQGRCVQGINILWTVTEFHKTPWECVAYYKAFRKWFVKYKSKPIDS